jgi:hypothetical protein
MPKKGSGATPFYQPQFLVRPFGLPSPWLRNLHRRTREREREERGVEGGDGGRKGGMKERKRHREMSILAISSRVPAHTPSKLTIPYSLSLRETSIFPPHQRFGTLSLVCKTLFLPTSLSRPPNPLYRPVKCPSVTRLSVACLSVSESDPCLLLLNPTP